MPRLCELPRSSPLRIQNDEGNPNRDFPSRIFSPYVDVTAWPTFDVVKYSKQTGVKYFTLAFVTASSTGSPAWGGVQELQQVDNIGLEKLIASVRQELKGDVIVSFGGASGTELSLSSNSPEELAEKYLAVINTYRITWIDLDIEGSALSAKTNAASITRRNKALKLVRAKAKWPLTISYTLPSIPSGLEDDSIFLLQNAMENGAQIDVVNLMTMDFGEYNAPNGATGMGGYAISAAGRARDQLNGIKMQAKVGVTPMIGVNDVRSEVFRLEDAAAVARWAKGSGFVGFVGMWSTNRDNDKFKIDPSETRLYASSLVAQDNGEFGRTFLAFE
ncbi:hypothetical protein HDU96_006526 [Phlyctochytrium bullatum]|nr:hypothetical protein HDU96_006526 [Phlyctochytrium bullatum]